MDPISQTAVEAATTPRAKIAARDCDVFYGAKHAIKKVSIDIRERQVVAFIGPSGCGKSTFLRCLNRMNDTIEGCRVTGGITLDGDDIYAASVDVVQLRARVGMVFQKPNPFPKSIYDNVAYGPRIHGLAGSKSELDGMVEQALRGAALWDEVADRLDAPGTGLSGGQQQRLCIARAIAVSPEVILMDEPAGGIGAADMQDLARLIKSWAPERTVLLVEHHMELVMDVCDLIWVLDAGKVIAAGTPDEVRNDPAVLAAYLGEEEVA